MGVNLVSGSPTAGVRGSLSGKGVFRPVDVTGLHANGLSERHV